MFHLAVDPTKNIFITTLTYCLHIDEVLLKSFQHILAVSADYDIEWISLPLLANLSSSVEEFLIAELDSLPVKQGIMGILHSVRDFLFSTKTESIKTIQFLLPNKNFSQVFKKLQLMMEDVFQHDELLY